jgi:hypothetical protein
MRKFFFISIKKINLGVPQRIINYENTKMEIPKSKQDHPIRNKNFVVLAIICPKISENSNDIK